MNRTQSIDVIYAANLKPGDLYAGRVAPGSGRPVLPNAAALEIATITPYDDGGRELLALTAVGLETYPLTPVDASCQVLVIRGA